MKVVLHHKFGPHVGDYRVVRSITTRAGERTIRKAVLSLNRKLGIKIRGTMIYPRIGQKYYIIERS